MSVRRCGIKTSQETEALGPKLRDCGWGTSQRSCSIPPLLFLTWFPPDLWTWIFIEDYASHPSTRTWSRQRPTNLSTGPQHLGRSWLQISGWELDYDVEFRLNSIGLATNPSRKVVYLQDRETEVSIEELGESPLRSNLQSASNSASRTTHQSASGGVSSSCGSTRMGKVTDAISSNRFSRTYYTFLCPGLETGYYFVYQTRYFHSKFTCP